MSGTFAGRVARAMALTAALSALGATALTTLLADRWMLAREDGRLASAAAILEREIAATPGDARSAAAAADDENLEVTAADMRIALYDGPRRLGGDVSLALPPRPGCSTITRSGAPWRRCVLRASRWRVVVISDLRPVQARHRVIALAALAAGVFAALAALALSRVVSAEIVRPLARLRDRVSRVDADAPGRAALGVDEGYDEIDALRQTLADLLHRHETSLSQSRRFSADAAHELRTPLTNALGELELLRAETSESDARAALAKVQRTLHGVSEMVERLLILAMPPDTARDAREAVAMSDVIDEVLGSLDDGARARVSLRVDEGAYVRGDATLLRVMAANAIGNALKFAPDDTVEIEVSRAEGDVVLRVSDRGPGVASGDRVRVFEAFYRSDAARAGAASGHGVGLALVAHVARLHGGDARFEDAATGASLRITLPAWTPGRR